MADMEVTFPHFSPYSPNLHQSARDHTSHKPSAAQSSALRGAAGIGSSMAIGGVATPPRPRSSSGAMGGPKVAPPNPTRSPAHDYGPLWRAYAENARWPPTHPCLSPTRPTATLSRPSSASQLHELRILRAGTRPRSAALPATRSASKEALRDMGAAADSPGFYSPVAGRGAHVAKRPSSAAAFVQRDRRGPPPGFRLLAGA